MNQARKRTTMQKVLSMILVLVMLLSLMSMSAFTMATNETGASSSARNDFMRVFHLDCGRKYFSVAEIKSLIDTASAANYTHIKRRSATTACVSCWTICLSRLMGRPMPVMM